MENKFEEKKGVIRIQNEDSTDYYKSLAIFSKEKYKNTEIELMTKSPDAKKRKNKIIKMFVPDIQTSCNSDLKDEYSKYDKYIKNIKEFSAEDLKDKINKYRPYLKIVKETCDIGEKNNILTFILYNPSTANHYELDDTIKNCAYLTFNKKSYNGFEILNVFDIRDPKIDLILTKIDNKETVNSNFEYNDIIVGKEIFLSWGCSNKKYLKDRITVINESFKNIIKNFEKPYKYFVLKTLKEENYRVWHLGNQCWNNKKLSFKKNICNQIFCSEINNFKGIILKNGFIQ